MLSARLDTRNAMYICLCHAVTERSILEAVDRGVSTYRELSFSTGCGTQCGSCARAARQLFEQALSERNQIPLPVLDRNAVAA